MPTMILETPRLLLRDFHRSDRPAFVAYQTDPRYRRLYGFGEDDRRAHALFDLFLEWQSEQPRRDLQVGIFDNGSGRLCGCCGLRRSTVPEGVAVLGIELTPDDWGRYRLAIDAVDALIGYAFADLGLDLIVGWTASGNRRAERLARHFGASLVGRRDGPEWMAGRGQVEVQWALPRAGWRQAERRRRPMRG